MPTLADYNLDNREVQVRSRGLNIRDLGNPKEYAKYTDEGDPSSYWVMGMIMGIVNGVVTYTDKKELTTSEGLKGYFRMLPSNPKYAVSEGGILYLPNGIHEAIVAPMKGDNPPAQISFALEFRVHPDSNASGRTYTVKSVMPVEVHTSDPLAALEARLGGRRNGADDPEMLTDGRHAPEATLPQGHTQNAASEPRRVGKR